jgi:hypothetical protein
MPSPWRVKALRSDGQVVPSSAAAAFTEPSCSASWKARSASPRSVRKRLGGQPLGGQRQQRQQRRQRLRPGLADPAQHVKLPARRTGQAHQRQLQNGQAGPDRRCAPAARSVPTIHHHEATSFDHLWLPPFAYHSMPRSGNRRRQVVDEEAAN